MKIFNEGRNLNILLISALATSVLLGVGIGYLLFNKEVPIQTSMKISSADPDAVISGEKLEVKSTHNTVRAVASFHTDRAGVYTNTISINRRELQYKHSLEGGVGYWIHSKMPYVSIAYSYKWVVVGIQAGYSAELRRMDYGAFAGVRFRF